MKKLLVILIISEISLICFCEQPYTVQTESIEAFQGDEITTCDTSKLKTVRRERFINGSILFHEDMDSDHYKFQVDMYSSPSGDGNFKRMPMGVPNTGICEGMKDIYSQIVQPSLIYDQNTNFPHVPEDGLCPLPGGEYYIREIEFNTDTWPNQIPRGIMKAVLTFFKDDVSVGGLVLKMKIEDRKS